MNQRKAKCALLAMVFLVMACAPNATPPPGVTTVPSATATAVASATRGATATLLPTRTPAPTSTPKPVAVIVTSRPPGNPNPIWITDRIGFDYKTLNIPQDLWFQRITWVKDVKFDYMGGAVLLSSASSGMKPVLVDDVLAVKILHGDGTFDTFEYDFSNPSSTSGPQAAGPFDLTAFFHAGLNMLYVSIYDTGYSYWGTESLWIVEFR